MLIVDVKKAGNINKALKEYKFKVARTRQIDKLRDRQEYKKKSALRRAEILKAKYRQSQKKED